MLLFFILVCLAHALPIIDLGLNKDGWDAAISAALQPPLPTPVDAPGEPVQIVVHLEDIEMTGVYCKELGIILVNTYQPVQVIYPVELPKLKSKKIKSA